MDKKEIRKTCNYVSGGALLYALVSIGAVMLWFIVIMIGIMLRVKNEAEVDIIIDSMFTASEQSGGAEIFGVLCGMIILLLYFRNKVTRQEIFEKNKAMTKEHFVKIACVFLAGQFVFSTLGELMEKGANLFGYSMVGSLESASSVSTTVTMFLYASFLGPIVEELVYRGFVLRSFMKYGKLPAIIFSSILFGVMHGNLPQIIFAFAVGLILGYVTVEYSIRYSMLLHVINNFVFVDLLGFLIKTYSESTQNIIYAVINHSLFLVAVVILWKNRKGIKEYLATHRTEGKFYRYMFTSVFFLIFIALHLMEGILLLECL